MLLRVLDPGGLNEYQGNGDDGCYRDKSKDSVRVKAHPRLIATNRAVKEVVR